MNILEFNQRKVVTIFGFIILGILFLNIPFLSASIKEEKVTSITLIADRGNPDYVIGHPLNPTYWKVNTVLILDNSFEKDLVNPINLEEGDYVARISDGAWSRWMIDNFYTIPWVGYLGNIGGNGLTWESTANIVYKDNGKLKIVKFGEMGLFATKQEAENAGKGSELEFHHDGGKIYLFFNDYITYDNRGAVTIDIYKITEKNNDKNEKKGLKIIDSSESHWQCGGWSECIDGVQTRNCEDLNHLDFSYNKPSEVQGCSTSLENITESAKIEKEFNYLFWLLVGIVIVLVLIIITAIIRR